MKLYGGSGKFSSGQNKKKMSLKIRIMIAITLIISAAMLVSAAVAINNIKPPDTVEAGRTSDGVESIDVTEAARKGNIFTVLVVGTDKVSQSTDTIMLAAFDTEKGSVNLLSIPRDTIIKTNRANKKINAVYASNDNDMSALCEEVYGVTGIYPDRYVLVSLEGFERLVDAVGGITVDVPINMQYYDPAQDLKIDIKKGVQTLDGKDAVGFMRFRKTYVEGDIGRIKMQHVLIDALADKMLTPQTLTKISELADIIKENVETDLSIGNIIWLGKHLLFIDKESSLTSHLLPGYAEYYEGLSYYFPSESEALSLINEFYNPYAAPIEKLDLFKK